MDTSREIIKKLRESRLLSERKEYEKMSKEELVKLAKEDNDQLAFATLIDMNQEFFYKMTKKYVAEGTFGQDDIIQIAEIAYWEALQKWDGTGDFDAFAGMVIKRRMSDELRKLDTDKQYANRNTRSIETTEEGPDDSRDDYGDMNKSEFDSWISHSSKSAEDEYMDQEFEKEMKEFFTNEMTEIERKLIRLYLDGYKMSQIAEETGVSYKSCENAVRRAKNKLKDYFNNMRESRQLKEGKESIFSDEETQLLKKVLNSIDESEDTDIED